MLWAQGAQGHGHDEQQPEDEARVQAPGLDGGATVCGFPLNAMLVDLKDAPNAPPAHYRLLKGGLTEAGSGDLAFTNSAAKIDSAFDASGTMLMEVTWKPEEGKPAPIAP